MAGFDPLTALSGGVPFIGGGGLPGMGGGIPGVTGGIPGDPFSQLLSQLGLSPLEFAKKMPLLKLAGGNSPGGGIGGVLGAGTPFV